MATEPTAREKFEAGLRKLVSVPKIEIVRREKEYKADRKKRKSHAKQVKP